MRRLFCLVAVAISGLTVGCEGPFDPNGSGDTFGPQPPLPAQTFLDDRLAVCPTAAQVASVSDVPQFWPAQTGPLVCTAAQGSADLTTVQKRATWGLIIMKELRFDRPLPWTTKPLYDWFTDLISGIHFFPAPGNSSCCSANGVMNIVYTPVDSEVLKWPSLQNLIGGLVHEARHREVGGHPCGNLDNRVDAMGAFGVHNLFFTWIGRHSDPAVIPIEYRDYALYVACRQRTSAFCDEPPQTCG